MRSKTISFTGAAELSEGSGAPLPERAVDGLTGRTLGDFVVRDKMGEGGFGSVYRAEQPTLAREAVIKVVNSGLRGREDITGRFMREARLASSLDHPFAAHIYAFGAEPDGLLWIAMELVRGTPLDRVLEGQGPVPLQRLVPLVERICEVVHSAHEEGIIHRDLKPANVVVISRSGRLMPKLLDFGIAKLREDAFHADVEGAKAGEGSSGADLPAHSTLTPAPLPPFAAPVLQDTGGLGKTQVGKKLIPAQSLMDTPAGERFQMALSMHLTQEGLFIGSPHYMAPEQWLNAASVDARTDLYALAVLTYQCLTGKLPFDGETLREVRDKHMTDPVPSVGPDFPAAMDAFFRKALGKMPEGRYPDALELGAALRAASGLAEERVQLPQLDELAREMVIAEAPQPLAEAVAALESARNAQHALELTRTALRTVVQFLGTVALAGRVRQGSGGAADTAAVLELLGKLRRSSLSELEWLELTYGLCVPFQGQRDVHPTPELVAFFCEPTPSGATGNEQLRELTQEALKPDANEDEARGRLTELLPRVATTLRELGPLFQYTLAYARQGRLEKWMGVRRTHRPVMQKAPEGPDRLLLTDAEGAPVVTLSPLAQVMAPSPGAPEEVFFLEGDGRHGAKLRALPSNFERHDGELWAWFREHLANVEAGTSGAAEDDRPPYLGLSSFSVADAKNFYGREQEAESFANRLRVNSLLAVVGPSGSGKSSFIQAGVLPLLPKDWRAATVRPGPQPLLALQTRLTQLGIAAEGLREELARRPEALGEKLLELVPGGGTLVLVVDQFEELITLCADADEREQYARALVRASDASGGRVRIIATLRDDFLIRCQAVPSLRERLGQGLQLLGTPAREDLLRILTEPARHAGYEFESPELPAEMVQAVSDQPGALALLSFTATRLWELRDRQLKRLTRKAYQALGGVGGALAHHAEATMGAMSEPAQKLVREAFRHLVTAEGTRAILSRGDMVQLLGGGAPADEVLESLIHARLLVASEGQAERTASRSSTKRSSSPGHAWSSGSARTPSTSACGTRCAPRPGSGKSASGTGGCSGAGKRSPSTASGVRVTRGASPGRRGVRVRVTRRGRPRQANPYGAAHRGVPRARRGHDLPLPRQRAGHSERCGVQSTADAVVRRQRTAGVPR